MPTGKIPHIIALKSHFYREHLLPLIESYQKTAAELFVPIYLAILGLFLFSKVEIRNISMHSNF